MLKNLLTTFLLCVIPFALYAHQTPTPIITRWITNNTTATDNTIIIPAYGSYTYTWHNADSTVSGSGTVNNPGTTDLNTSITFPTPGEYTVNIRPTSPNFKFYFNATTATEISKKLVELKQWGNNSWNANLERMFKGCSNMKITATDVPNFSNVTNMGAMFFGCSSLTTVPNMNSWDTSNVTFMSELFFKATNFNQDIGNWDTSNVTTMSYMFYDATNFNKYISN